MAQVMRNRTRHSSNGRESLGGEQFFLRTAKAAPHSIKRLAQFSNFFRACALELIVKISSSERARSCNKPVQGPRDRSGEKDCQCSTEEQQKSSQQKQHIIEMRKVLACLVVGFKNNQLDGGLITAGEQR